MSCDNVRPLTAVPSLERVLFSLQSLICLGFSIWGVLSVRKCVPSAAAGLLRSSSFGGFVWKSLGVSTVTGLCGEGQPWRAQHLCSALLWGDPFVLSELESSPGGWGWGGRDWKTPLCSGTYFFPVESAAWNKALPGLSHLYARCGFLVFLSANCVPTGVFYGFACTCSKTIKNAVVLEGRRWQRWGGVQWPREIAGGIAAL